jgi:hypothetical protein
MHFSLLWPICYWDKLTFPPIKKELPSLNIKRRMSLQVFDLKGRSPAWAKALFLKRILTLRAGATLFPCTWH